ncbi:methylglutaconyl-CoA hydratase mitochondrial precursor [Usnea florida]
MRPPHHPTLILSASLKLRLPFNLHLNLHPHRLSSTTTQPPTLLKTHTIPAPHIGHIRVLSLNNPATRNAISRQLLRELRAEIDALKREAGTRVLILASELDECFCAGADLKERKGMSGEETTHFLTTLRTTLTTLSALPIPTISAISSLALGGGLELALSTTFRILASSALVGLPETRLAIIPGAGGTWRLRGLVGEQRAMEMCLTGRRVGGWEAGRMGICERVVDVRGRVLEGAVGMAREICEGGPGAVGAVMRAVREGTGEAEGREYEGVVGMGDRDEALRAFGEKRKAVFRGL